MGKSFAPKFGGKAYWSLLICSSLIFQSIISVFISAVIAGLLNINFYYLIPIFVISFVSYSVFKKHKKLEKMSFDEYKNSFVTLSREELVQSRSSDDRRDTGSPYDPASNNYWTIGPGSP